MAAKLTTPFSRYHTEAIVRGDSAVLYVRTLEMDQAVIPAEEYNQLARFYRDVARADKAQIVLARKE
jgi:hypothetical protein